LDRRPAEIEIVEVELKPRVEADPTLDQVGFACG
jgi:hypothetical protein